MKHFLSILILFFALCVPRFTSGQIPAQNNDIHASSLESYGTVPYYWLNSFRAGFFWLMYPQFTNEWVAADQSGANIGTLADENIERRIIPTAQYGGRVFVDFLLSENGGFFPTAQLPSFTNICLAPGVVVENSAYVTNGGYFAAASNTWTVMIDGAIPDGDSENEDRNNTGTNYAIATGIPYCDWFHAITTNGFTDPMRGTNLFGFFAGGHPFPAGHAMMAFTWLMSLTNFNTVTNVNACTLDFNDGSIVSTNHCVVLSPSKDGKSLSFTWHADRHSMAFDVPGIEDDITNDCRDVFRIHPAFTNLFYETVQVLNVPDGAYNWMFDGKFVRTVTGAELRNGINLFLEYNTQLWKQKMEVLGRIREQNGTDRNGAVEHSAGDGGIIGALDGVNVRSRESIYDSSPFPRGTNFISTASITNAVADFKSYDHYIWQAAQPTNHTFTITLAAPRFAPYHK